MSSRKLSVKGALVCLGACLAAGLLLDAPAVVGAPPPPPPPLELPALLDAVAAGSHAAQSAAADLAGARARVDRGRAGWWPAVDLSGAYIMRDNPVEAQAGPLTIATSQKNNAQYALQVRELLYDGGRRGLAVDAARQAAEAVRLGGEAAVQQAQLDAVDAYLQVLELKGSRRVLELRRQSLAAHLKTVQDLLDHGLTARNDVLETQVRVRRVADQLQAVEDHLAVARGDLNRRMGRDPAQAVDLPDSLPAAPALAADLDALRGVSRERNVSLLAARARHEAGLSELALARRAWFPSLFVGVDHQYVENSHLVHEFVNSVSAGVSWNLFDGGARQADVRAAQARTARADRDRLEAARTVDVALDGAWRGWQQALREHETAVADVAAAAENLRLVADQYGEGLARSSDVLDAETLLAGSRYDAVRSHYRIYRAQARLLVAAGRDLKAFYAGVADTPPSNSETEDRG